MSAPSQRNKRNAMISMLTLLSKYKAWANVLTFESILALPAGEAIKQRPTNFGSIAHTLNHVYVVDDIFRHHLRGEKHGYKMRNTPETPPLAKLWEDQQGMDRWWVNFAETLAPDQGDEVIEFTFVGGGNGRMSKSEIIFHIVNHGTYHRGFVSDMMYQIPARPPANDFPVFLRQQAEHS